MSLREWATKGLRSGDLTTLAAIARRARGESDRVERFARRGFVMAKKDGEIAVTAKGRLAGIIRNMTR
jgi:hypothetical protein